MHPLQGMSTSIIGLKCNLLSLLSRIFPPLQCSQWVLCEIWVCKYPVPNNLSLNGSRLHDKSSLQLLLLWWLQDDDFPSSVLPASFATQLPYTRTRFSPMWEYTLNNWKIARTLSFLKLCLLSLLPTTTTVSPCPSASPSQGWDKHSLESFNEGKMQSDH